MYVVAVLPAAAIEDIRLYESRIVVGEDGVLTVTEIITVNAEGREIRRGIYRDFPTRYRDEYGLLRTATFEVLRVLRNGAPEPWFTKRMGAGTRVYAGQEDRFIPDGVHTYEIVYRTDRQLRYFDDYDEVFWNVTGNHWSFPIRHVRASVTLPAGAAALQWAVYTGRYGETGKDAQIISQTQRTFTFESTRTLQPGEGMSVAVGFEKGVVPVPSAAERFWQKAWDNIGIAIFWAVVPLLMGYLFLWWTRIGKDPAKRAIIPRFKAPRGLSPGAVSYLYWRGFKTGWRGGASKAFIAALTALAVKGRLVIDEADGTPSARATGRAYNTMTDDEKALDVALMGGADEVEFKKKNATRIRQAIADFRSKITSMYEGVYYSRNLPRVVLVAVVYVVLVIALLILGRPGEDVFIPVLFASIFGGVSLVILSLAIGSLLGFTRSTNPVAAIIMLIPGSGIMFVPFIMLFAVPAGVMTLTVLLGIAMVITIITFAWLMPAPTESGQRLAEEIEGYRLYLSVAEAERMNMEDAPPVNESVFEEHLPYAIGLGVEKQWSNAFASALAAAGKDPNSYRPRYHHGGTWQSSRLSRATGGLVSAVSSSIASATPSSSSRSSGSGGGGFSGGGGGGGGGGGW